MAITKEQENKLDEVLHEAMKKQFYRGMSIGAQSICKVILDLLNDSALPFAKRITTVKQYCEKSLKNGKLMFGDDQQNPTAETGEEKNTVEPAQEEPNNE